LTPRPGSRKPRCVHLVPRTDDAGAENQARYLVRGLQDSGLLDTEVAYFGRGDGHAAFEELNVPLRNLEARRRLLLDARRRIRGIRALGEERPPEILHTWLLEGNILGLVAARRWPQTKIVITQGGGINEWDWPWHMRAQRVLLGRADHAISNSTSGRDVLVELGLDASRISVIGNAVPGERIAVKHSPDAVRQRLGLQTRPLLVWMGRLSDPRTFAQKDIRTFLAAIEEVRRRYPRVIALLCRPTPSDLRTHGITAPAYVRAIGYRQDAAEILNAADVVVSSSRVEGRSGVVGEALMLGKAVACTNSGDHAELVRRAGGRVTDPGDAAALGRAIVEMVERPPDGRFVRKVAATQLDVSSVVDAVLDVYRRVGVKLRSESQTLDVSESSAAEFRGSGDLP
jgi:glycosyltransferase involved in cell wall biosynthesis